MRKHIFPIAILLILLAEIAAVCLFASQDTDSLLDAVAVNEAVHSVAADWSCLDRHTNETKLDYVVLDADSTVRFRTRIGLSESLHDAVLHRDTILDIEREGQTIGKIIIYNDSTQSLQSQKRTIIIVLVIAILLQCSVSVGYILYLEHTMIRPFNKLKCFAERVAGGNLDVPLAMDRQNLFGAFTESFDIMRSELKRARIAEAEANASKKELVAKLSHDIKTPVASIKAASEVGAALTDSERLRDNYTQIIRKADQINTLVSNLFTATLEELKQLTVTPADLESDTLRTLLESSDYLHRAALPAIPDCLLHADALRLQQVFDNVFANSCKYAGTPIDVTVSKDSCRLTVTVEDCGGGVGEEELPLIKEKFKRGSNAAKIEGAGLGLYISDYFMSRMHGELVVENGGRGLRVSVCIALSGTM